MRKLVPFKVISIIGLLVMVVSFPLLLRIFVEEKLLRERYAEYGEYAERTKRLIPFLV
jgi:protein-S-isoprenylcysteine O-methyltransferase Ste14